MKRRLLILTITLLGLAVENVYAQNEVAENVECIMTVDCENIAEETVAVTKVCVEEPAVQETSFMQQYGFLILILGVFIGIPLVLTIVIIAIVKAAKRPDELTQLQVENERLRRESEIARLKEENERLRNNLK